MECNVESLCPLCAAPVLRDGRRMAAGPQDVLFNGPREPAAVSTPPGRR